MKNHDVIRPGSLAIAGLFLIAVIASLLLWPNSVPRSYAAPDSDTCVIQPFTTIAGISQPKGLAVDEEHNLLFVASHNANSLLVIDGLTNRVVRTVSNILSPNQIAFNPTNQRLYVTNRNQNTVTVLDAQSYNLLATIPVSPLPYGVAVNPTTDHAYVAAFGGNRLNAIWDGAMQREFGIPNYPTFVAVDSITGQVYVVSNVVGAIYTVENDETLSHWVSPGDTGIVGLALDTGNQRLYISSVGKKVYVYDTTSKTRLAVVNLPGVPKALAFDAQNRQLYAAPAGGTHSAYQIDGIGSSYRTEAAVGNGDGDGIAVNSVTGRLYVANFQDNSISVLKNSCAPPDPVSHLVGRVELFADKFEVVGNQTRATGHIRLNQFFALEDGSGAEAWVLFDQRHLTGNGRLVMKSAGQQLALLQGDFRADGSSGLLTGGENAQILLDRVSGFPVVQPPRFTAVDLVAGAVRGQAALDAGNGSFSARGLLDFLIGTTTQGMQTTGEMTFNQAITYGNGSVLSLSAGKAPLGSDAKIVWNTTLHLHLPEGRQSIPVQVSLSSAGIQAALSDLELPIAGGKLTFYGVVLNNSGLAANRAELTLTNSLGGGRLAVVGAAITASGLQYNAISLSSNHPPTLGAGGFGISLQTIALEASEGGRSHEIAFTGQISLTRPGVEGSALAVLRVDSQGQFRGSVSNMTIRSAGLAIRATGISVEGKTLRASQADLTLPPGLGGASLTVGNLALSPDGLTIGGGTFALPDIDVGGFRLTALRGSFIGVTGGYAIEAGGGFSMPNLGGKGCSGLAVNVKFCIVEGGVLALEIRSPLPAVPLSPLSAVAPDRFIFDSLALQLRCTIPIGSTGLEIVAVRGQVVVPANGPLTISVGMTVESSLKSPKTLFAADADVTLRAQPFLLTFDGTVRLFGETMGGAQASIESERLSVNLWVNYKIFEGRVAINAWSDAGGFHFTGEGYVGVQLTKGNILDLGWLKVPPASLSVGGVKLGVGEFTNRQWGFRGQVCVWKYCTGVYVDTGGTVHFGNVDQYTLASPPTLADARSRWLAYRRGERSAADLPENITLLDNGDLVITATVTSASDLMFVLSRQSSAVPTLTLVEPGGAAIGPDTPRTDINFASVTEMEDEYPYQQIFTVDAAQPGVWTAILHDAPEQGYGFALLGLAPAPALADVHAQQTGDRAGQMSWRLTATQPVTVSVYANAGAITQTLTLTTTVPVSVVVESFSGTRLYTVTNALADGSLSGAALDLSSLPSGVYHLWIDADDGVNPPQRLYAGEPVTVSQTWAESWPAQLVAWEGFQKIRLNWQPHPSPDVQGYSIFVSAQPFTVTRTFAVGAVTETILNGLNSNTLYAIWVDAVVYAADGSVIRSAHSDLIHATPASMPFDLALESAPTTLRAGAAMTVSLRLHTDAPDFPEPVSFYPAGELPAGIGIDLPSRVITPSQAGESVPVALRAASSAPGGVTQIAILASGGGVTRTVVISLTLSLPQISLEAEPQHIFLHESSQTSSQIRFTTTGDVATSALLFVQNVPPGIIIHLDKETLLAGESTILRVQASEQATPGVYDLELIAQAGPDRWMLPLRIHLLAGRVIFVPVILR